MAEDKEKTISFRITEDKYERLKELSEDENVSISNLMRTGADSFVSLNDTAERTESSPTELMEEHVDALENDEFYRETIDGLYNTNENLQEYVSSREEFDTKWVDETTVEYEKMFENFQEIVFQAQRHNFDEAEEMIDDIEEQGHEQEAYLLNSVVSEYRK